MTTCKDIYKILFNFSTSVINYLNQRVDEIVIKQLSLSQWSWYKKAYFNEGSEIYQNK